MGSSRRTLRTDRDALQEDYVCAIVASHVRSGTLRKFNINEHRYAHFSTLLDELKSWSLSASRQTREYVCRPKGKLEREVIRIGKVHCGRLLKGLRSYLRDPSGTSWFTDWFYNKPLGQTTVLSDTDRVLHAGGKHIGTLSGDTRSKRAQANLSSLQDVDQVFVLLSEKEQMERRRILPHGMNRSGYWKTVKEAIEGLALAERRLLLLMTSSPTALSDWSSYVANDDHDSADNVLNTALGRMVGRLTRMKMGEKNRARVLEAFRATAVKGITKKRHPYSSLAHYVREKKTLSFARVARKLRKLAGADYARLRQDQALLKQIKDKSSARTWGLVQAFLGSTAKITLRPSDSPDKVDQTLRGAERTAERRPAHWAVRIAGELTKGRPRRHRIDGYLTRARTIADRLRPDAPGEFMKEIMSELDKLDPKARKTLSSTKYKDERHVLATGTTLDSRDRVKNARRTKHYVNIKNWASGRLDKNEVIGALDDVQGRQLLEGYSKIGEFAQLASALRKAKNELYAARMTKLTDRSSGTRQKLKQAGDKLRKATVAASGFVLDVRRDIRKIVLDDLVRKQKKTSSDTKRRFHHQSVAVEIINAIRTKLASSMTSDAGFIAALRDRGFSPSGFASEKTLFLATMDRQRVTHSGKSHRAIGMLKSARSREADFIYLGRMRDLESARSTGSSKVNESLELAKKARTSVEDHGAKLQALKQKIISIVGTSTGVLLGVVGLATAGLGPAAPFIAAAISSSVSGGTKIGVNRAVLGKGSETSGELTKALAGVATAMVGADIGKLEMSSKAVGALVHATLQSASSTTVNALTDRLASADKGDLRTELRMAGLGLLRDWVTGSLSGIASSGFSDGQVYRSSGSTLATDTTTTLSSLPVDNQLDKFGTDRGSSDQLVKEGSTKRTAPKSSQTAPTNRQAVESALADLLNAFGINTMESDPRAMIRKHDHGLELRASEVDEIADEISNMMAVIGLFIAGDRTAPTKAALPLAFTKMRIKWVAKRKNAKKGPTKRTQPLAGLPKLAKPPTNKNLAPLQASARAILARYDKAVVETTMSKETHNAIAQLRGSEHDVRVVKSPTKELTGNLAEDAKRAYAALVKERLA